MKFTIKTDAKGRNLEVRSESGALVRVVSMKELAEAFNEVNSALPEPMDINDFGKLFKDLSRSKSTPATEAFIGALTKIVERSLEPQSGAAS